MPTIEAVNLTDRMKNAFNRLDNATIGRFTVSEFLFLQNSQHMRRTDRLRIHNASENMPLERSPAAELEFVERLECLARKAGV